MIKIIETKQGGFGRVDICEDPAGFRYAVKTFSPPSAGTPEQLGKLKSRFQREVAVQGQLPPELFLPVLNLDLNCAEPWFAMPVAEMSFDEFIQRNAPDAATFLDPLLEILNGLEYLHGLDYRHRDLKPANVLRHEGRWKLADFGLVSPLSGHTSCLTSTNSAWGTVEFAAPEQVLDFHNVTFAADIFSFGCILHNVFVRTARVPYQQTTGPGAVGAVIERCTAANPSERFQGISPLRASLITALEQPWNVVPSQGTAEWVARMPGIQAWEQQMFLEFGYLLRSELPYEDQMSIFHAIDETVIQTLFHRDAQAWRALVAFYCARADSSLPFSYCDVVGTRLRLIYDNGSFSDKARAAIATATTAARHNRWFVMDIAMGMIDASIDDQFARRMNIEIRASGSAGRFLECSGVKRDLSMVHPIVKQCLVA